MAAPTQSPEYFIQTYRTSSNDFSDLFIPSNDTDTSPIVSALMIIHSGTRGGMSSEGLKDIHEISLTEFNPKTDRELAVVGDLATLAEMCQKIEPEREEIHSLSESILNKLGVLLSPSTGRSVSQDYTGDTPVPLRDLLLGAFSPINGLQHKK